MRDACAEFEPDLSALLDGELTDAREREVAAHVAACDACRRTSHEVARVSAALRRWDAAETRYVSSPGFRNRVLARVAAPDPSQSPAARAAEPTPIVRLPVPAWHRAAAAAVLLVGAGLATALVVPALSDHGPRSAASGTSVADADLAALLERASSTPLVAENAADGSRAARDWPASASWQSVVSEPRELSGAEPRSESSRLDIQGWERHGEFRLHADAVGDYQRFNGDRRLLSLEEQLRAPRGDATATAATDSNSGETREASPLTAYLTRAQVSDARLTSHARVQVWPILVEGAGNDGMRPLMAEEALRDGILQARQTSSSGALHTVQLENADAQRAILILAGDVFQGGSRDFVAATDTLVAPGQRVSISSRPSGKRRGFRSSRYRRSGGIAPVRLRQLLSGTATDAEAWDHAVKDVVAGLASMSRAGSLDNVFLNDVLLREVDRQAQLFAARLDGQEVVGFAVAAGPELLGVEVFGDQAMFQSARTRLLRSYLLEARLRGLAGKLPKRDQVVALLDAARESRPVRWSSGGGELASFTSVDSGVHGFGILDGSSAVHASIFPPSGTRAGSTGARRGRSGADGGADGLGGDGGGETGPSKGSATPAGPGLSGR